MKNFDKLNDASTITLRLKDECDRLSLTGTALANKGQWAKSTVSNWLNGVSSPSAEFLAVVQNLGADVPYILTGERSAAAVKPKTRTLSGAATAPADDADTIYLSVMSACGSMGPGNELLTEDVLLGEVPFSRRWLSLNIPGCRPDALRLIHAYGDSMAGTLNSGDFAVIDTSCCTVDYPGVYLLHVNRLLFIKRVSFRMDGRMVVSSDNQAAPVSEVLDGAHQLDVRGRVVYGWNGKRF